MQMDADIAKVRRCASAKSILLRRLAMKGSAGPLGQQLRFVLSVLEEQVGTIDSFATRISELEEALKREAHISDLLRDDLVEFADDDYAHCDGCAAPISYTEDASTVDDVRGCWGYAADVKNTPCWRYRTKAGMERAWPKCAALQAQENAAPPQEGPAE
jgi:hypothetical protein